EFVRAVYKRLIVQPAEFMLEFRDPLTRLPKPSFDIWEERQGVFTFTCAAVCAGLHAASELANLFNEQELRTRYARAAAEVRDAIVRHLWLEQEGRFARATSVAELQSALDLVRWARSKARPSLILPEQIDPESGAPLSVAPFTWSHAQVVSVVRGYLDALRFLRRESRETVMRDEEKIARDHPVDKPKWFP